MNKLTRWFTHTFNEYYNPLYIWWKCRKSFNFPYIHLYCGKITWFFGMPINKYKYNKIFDFRMSALGWKWKYEYVRHEWNPYIVFTFFRKYQIMWTFSYVVKKDEESYTKNIATWEAMLDILYNNKTLNYAYKAHQWGTMDGKKIDIKDNLTWDGYFKVLLNENSSNK